MKSDSIIKKNILLMPIILFFIILIGYLLLVYAYLLPVSQIQKHVQEDYLSTVAVSEWIPGDADTREDFFTDSLMLLEAEYASKDSPFIASIKSSRALIPDVNYVYETYVLFNEGSANYDIYEYDYYRYWHGYLIFLKPLLFFFSLGNVKKILLVVKFLIMISVFSLASKTEFGFPIVYPLCAAYIYLNPITMALSLQFYSVFTITLLGVLFILYDFLNKKWISSFPYVTFFVIGVLVSYFDLLTYPLISFAIPALFFAFLYPEMQKIKYYLSFLLSWAVGYSSMWFGKWVLAGLVMPEDIWSVILNSIKIRSGFDATENFGGEFISFSEIVFRNFSIYPYLNFCIIISILLLLVYCIIVKYKIKLDVRFILSVY